MAVVVALMSMLLMSAVGAAVVLTTSAETAIAVHFYDGRPRSTRPKRRWSLRLPKSRRNPTGRRCLTGPCRRRSPASRPPVRGRLQTARRSIWIASSTG